MARAACSGREFSAAAYQPSAGIVIGVIAYSPNGTRTSQREPNMTRSARSSARLAHPCRTSRTPMAAVQSYGRTRVSTQVTAKPNGMNLPW